MSFQPVKLNYVAATAPFIPKDIISIPNSYFEKLDKAIIKRIKQNESEYIAGVEIAEHYIVR